jgi:hypothetical protein
MACGNQVSDTAIERCQPSSIAQCYRKNVRVRNLTVTYQA